MVSHRVGKRCDACHLTTPSRRDEPVKEVKYGSGSNARQEGHCGGATLLELMWAIAIVGTLLVVAMPHVDRWQDRLATHRAATELMSFYHHARYAGMMRAARVRMQFAPDTLQAYYESLRDSLFLSVPGPAARGVAMRASRSVIRIQANGIGWGAANTKIVLQRGSAAESLTTSRLGRLKWW